MKKSLMFAVLAFCSTSVLASSGFSSVDMQGNDFFAYTEAVGAKEVVAGVVKVENLEAQKDHARVTLEGNLESHFGGSHYMFKDSSGKVHVSIKPEVWQGVKVKRSDKVKLEGNLDKHRVPMSVDVDKVTVVK